MPKKKESTVIKSVLGKKRSENHYVDNVALYEELKVFLPKYREAKARGEIMRVPESIGSAILMIARRFASLHQFYHYPFKEDMISTAAEKCIRKIGNFDTDKFNNPFSYFTQTCFFEFIEYIKAEKQETYKKMRSVVDVFSSMQDSAHLEDPEHAALFTNMDLDIDQISAFVHEFETKNGMNKPRKKVERKKKNPSSVLDLEELSSGETE